MTHNPEWTDAFGTSIYDECPACGEDGYCTSCGECDDCGYTADEIGPDL